MRVFPDSDEEPGACRFHGSGFSPSPQCWFFSSFLGQIGILACFPASLMVVSFHTSMITRGKGLFGGYGGILKGNW